MSSALPTRRPVEIRVCVASSLRFVAVKFCNAVIADPLVRILAIADAPVQDRREGHSGLKPAGSYGIMPSRCESAARHIPLNPLMVSDWLTAPGTDGSARSRHILLEQRQDLLAVLVRDAEGLNAELLLHLKRLQLCRLLIHVGIDQSSDAGCDRVHQ